MVSLLNLIFFIVFFQNFLELSKIILIFSAVSPKLFRILFWSFPIIFSKFQFEILSFKFFYFSGISIHISWKIFIQLSLQNTHEFFKHFFVPSNLLNLLYIFKITPKFSSNFLKFFTKFFQLLSFVLINFALKVVNFNVIFLKLLKNFPKFP